MTKETRGGLQNFKGKRHELNKKDNSKGGKSTSIMKHLANRKKCNSKCKIFDKCWAQPYSKEQYEGECALKKMPERIRQRTIDFVTRGKEGFANQLTNLLLMWSNKVLTMPSKNANDTVNNVKLGYENKLIHDTIKVMETLYGKDTNIQLKADGTFTILDLQSLFNEEQKK